MIMDAHEEKREKIIAIIVEGKVIAEVNVKTFFLLHKAVNIYYRKLLKGEA